MFCKNCKKSGKPGEIYCKECGSKLKKEKIEFKISQKTKNTILIVIVIFLLLFLAYNITYYLLSPKVVAKKYFETLINNDTNEIYSYIDYKSDFVSKEILEEKRIPLKVEDYEITNIKIGEKSATVSIKYESNGEYNKAYVSLDRNKNKYLIFDEYKIESGLIVQNITFKVPKGSTITIDDKEISKYLTDSKNEYFDYYVIPYMIKGNYEIKTSLNGINVTDEIEVSSNQTYSINNVEVKDELETSLKQTALNKLTLIYNSALADKTFDEIKSNFKINKYDTLEDTYRSIKRGLNDSYIKVNNIEFKEASIKRITYSEEGKLVITLDTDYNINGVIELQEQKEFTSKNNSYIKVTFDYMDGTYDVSDINGTLNIRGF